MPSVLMAETMAMELGALNPWPDNSQIYQPLEREQILLHDNANSLGLQTYLKMCELPFELEMRANAEAMSPSGDIPFLKCGAFVLSDVEAIISFINSKGISLTQSCSGDMKSDIRSYMSLISNVLGSAEQYICWLDDLTYTTVTKPRYSSVYPWPLGKILTYRKRNEILKKLEATEWASKTVEMVYHAVDHCCSILSDLLGDQTYFFGSPTELDALVFGHVFSILTTKLPDSRLSGTIMKYKNLVEHCTLIHKSYFGETKSESLADW